MTMSNFVNLLFRAGVLPLALGLCTPWVLAQPQPKAPAAAQQGKDSARKTAKDVDKARDPAKQKRDRAARRYQDGLAHEKAGRDRAALKAFLEAGEAGHGKAQKKLSEIYDRGNSAAKRDYETSLLWYDKARAQGVQFPKPMAPIKGR